MLRAEAFERSFALGSFLVAVALSFAGNTSLIGPDTDAWFTKLQVSFAVLLVFVRPVSLR